IQAVQRLGMTARQLVPVAEVNRIVRSAEQGEPLIAPGLFVVLAYRSQILWSTNPGIPPLLTNARRRRQTRSLAGEGSPVVRKGGTIPDEHAHSRFYDRNPSVHRQSSRGRPRRSSPAYRRDSLAHQGADRRSLAGRAAGDDPSARPLLDDRLRLAQMRG